MTGPDAGWLIEWVERTGSTNADLAARAAAGRATRPRADPASGAAAQAADRTVLVADVQTAGRGRHGRGWTAPAGSSLMFSVLLYPTAVPPARRGWIGALAGMAAVAGIRRSTGITAQLKWPNDVLIGPHKVAGVLAEMVGDALVVGAGINVSVAGADLPRDDATSLLLAGARHVDCDRRVLLTAILDAFAPLLDRWHAASGDMDTTGLRREYLSVCSTIGQRVTIHLPDGRTVTGRAVDVARDGNIVIDLGAAPGGPLARFAAGDVVHLRAA